MSYVDGFVLPLPKDKVGEYQTLAESAAKIWMKHGALAYHECVADDMNAEFCTPFPKLAGTKDDETVVFAYVVYKSREHRDEVNKKVMADPGLKCDPNNMPFDVSRMAYGGFKSIVSFGE